MLVWNADLSLRVTSLSARLRDIAGIGSGAPTLHVSDLWGNDDRHAVAVAAHQWALEGELLAFEAPIGGTPYHCEVQPLHDPSGAVIGVAGRAMEVTDSSGLDVQTMLHAERSAGMGTWYEDLRTGAVTMSEGLAALLGTPRHVTDLDIRAFDHPDDRATIAETIANYANEDGYVCDHRILCLGSRIRIVRERVRAIFDDRGMPVARVGTLIDITDLKEREAELAELALHDPLTRLPNRTALEERLGSSIGRCDRNQRCCAVLFIDIDGFKSVNDAHGHQFGDRALVAVAHRLARNVRASDMVARLGGDEFIVLVDDLFTDEAALDAARKLLRSFDDPFIVNGEELSVNASIGVAVYPHSGVDPKMLLAVADREMYAVKRNGGRGVKLANASAWPAEYSADRPPFAILESA